MSLGTESGTRTRAARIESLGPPRRFWPQHVADGVNALRARQVHWAGFAVGVGQGSGRLTDVQPRGRMRAACSELVTGFWGGSYPAETN